MPFAATWMDMEIIILSEVSQTERQMSCDIAYMWNLKKKDTNENIYKTEQTHRKQIYGERLWGGIDWEFGIDIYTLLFFK